MIQIGNIRAGGHIVGKLRKQTYNDDKQSDAKNLGALGHLAQRVDRDEANDAFDHEKLERTC